MTQASLSQGRGSVRETAGLGTWPRGIAWLLFALLALRFAALWANVFLGTSLPIPGHVGLTALFAAFSVLHGATLLGWARALAFLLICAVVTWAFEEVGIATGLVYGAYHYGDQLGLKLGAVPLVIPFAWFMMVYASWVVAGLLLHGAGDPASWRRSASRVVVAALAMTTWDTVMDPGMALSGVWTWEGGGAYFGVPLHNYVGWLATTLAVFTLAEAMLRGTGAARGEQPAGLYAGLPALVYALVAVDRVLLPDLPELRIVAAFGMAFIALLTTLRLVAAPARP